MLMSTARILELSIAANVTDGLVTARQAEVDQMSSLLRRKLSARLLDLATNQPAKATRLMDKLCALRGLHYLGAGVEFSAYLHSASGEVTKIHRDSANKSPAERAQIAEEKRLGHAVLTNHLGGSVLRQTISIDEHLLGGGYQTVQIHQPLVVFDADDAPFTVNSRYVDLERLESITRRIPGADAGLGDFIERSKWLYKDANSLPDTNGQNNLVMRPDGSVTLLDTCPILPDNTFTQTLILDQLRSLEAGLQIING